MEEDVPSVEDRIINGLTAFRELVKPKVLSNRDKKIFLEMLKQDEPNDNLKKAVKRYKLKTSL